MLYVLPVLLIVGLGVYKTRDYVARYHSVGTVNVASATFLSDLTDVRVPNFGYETPASKTARSINELMRSDSFAIQVADHAGLTDAVKSGIFTLDDLRTNVYAEARGDTLLGLVAVADDPRLAAQLASSLITSYSAYVLAAETADSNAAADFYESQISTYETAVKQAQVNVDNYVADHKAPNFGERPENEVIELSRLNNQVQLAQTALDTAQAKLDEAKLATKTSESDIGQRLQVIDEPGVPVAPEGTLKKKVTTIGMFLVLGLVVGCAMLVISALLDRSIRSSNDLTAEGLVVLATVPRHRGRDRGHRLVPDLGLASTSSVHRAADRPA